MSDLCKGCTLCCTSVRSDPDRVPVFNCDRTENRKSPVMVPGSPCQLYECKFLTDKCSCYNDRPMVCRWYPFYLSKFSDSRYTIGIAVMRGCNLGKYISENCMSLSILNEAKRVFKEMMSMLTESEKSEWADRINTTYNYKFVYNPDVLSE